MFWIGMIVGAILTIAIAVGYVAYCCKVVGVTRHEFDEMSELIGDALVNRESEVEVWHDDVLIGKVVLEER